MRQRHCAGALIAVLAMVVAPRALAQSAIVDEAVTVSGPTTQEVALTAAQKHAIYNAILGQHVRPVAPQLPATVGASVPPSAQLFDLPDQATAGNPAAAYLKYALVESDVVVVDPKQMRVVDVIRGGATP